MPPSTPLSALFSLLPGTYALTRTLSSCNPTEPRGTCSGTASFTTISPCSEAAPHPDSERAAAHEMLYQEQGTFRLDPSLPAMTFTKGYIWRFDESGEKRRGRISTWFIRPGTEDVRDYLFHEFEFDAVAVGEEEGGAGSVGEEGGQEGEGERDEGLVVRVLHAAGSHLCVNDMYDTEYWFWVRSKSGRKGSSSSPGEEIEGSFNEPSLGSEPRELVRWRMKHVVRGPKKDQRIETVFTKL